MDRVRATAVEAGRIRCHILEIVPGVPGTSLEVEGALDKLNPGAVAVDVDLLDVLSYRRSGGTGHVPLPFPAEVVRRALDGRGEEAEVQNPYQAAAVLARRRNVPLVPLLPERTRPGWFLRRRLAREFARHARDQEAHELTLLWSRVAHADSAAKPLVEREDAETWRRFRDLVARDQAVRVVAVVRPPRADALASKLEAELVPTTLRGGTIALEDASLEPFEVGKGLR
ncbi:MAG TPA: hypothetical protein VI997_06285 [Candidatus Thermoplasmatota archaeon]|nr:hypothetical protein [Candidatus Thermoplasmatota archaeon]